MIALTDIGFEFGGRFLYRNANWHIKPNERIGLIGLNGTGKSTLLRIINGEYSLTEGNMSKPRDLTIGFLNGGDTTIRIWVDSAINNYEFKFAGKQVTYVRLDRNRYILNEMSFLTRDKALLTFDGILIDLGNVAVFPNPASQFIQIANGEGCHAEITDISGKLITQIPLSNATQIDIANYTNGLYFIKVISSSNAATFKFIKQ